MTALVSYSIDTSSIIHARRRAYPPDIFPSLWDRIEGLIQEHTLVATEEVLHELERQDDEIYRWASRQTEMFIPIDREIQPIVSGILLQHPNLIDVRRNRSGADPFVIALAIHRGSTVVTQEVPTNHPSRPHIPDVCAAVSIPCINILQLIREQGWSI
ncbi:MAG: hypothetical protein BZY80_07175 [SAR202 cluster bacterium Io17-Chloro-G2]|nr:MAG: hypothetical protein BZY80_07175 [SAR202 cluster bacterium Io17-Chloro-G2]